MEDHGKKDGNEPRPTWAKLNDGWKVRIPKDWWDNWDEAGETDSFPVFKANGEVSHVNIVRVSKSFVLNGVEYVIGTPKRETRRHAPTRRKTHASRRTPAARCDECGSTKGVHPAHDMSGIACMLCARCDDGTASVC